MSTDANRIVRQRPFNRQVNRGKYPTDLDLFHQYLSVIIRG
jgi:hypothetical protein